MITGIMAGHVKSSGTLLLDLYPGASIALSSSRKLRSAYSGACLRARRSSDNSEQDIGFSGGAVDSASLLSFVGSDSAYLVTLYDQSGNGRNATQSTTTKQPRLVDAGTLETVGGVLAPYYNGTSSAMSTAAFSPATADKVAVFFTVRVISATVGIIFETSANFNSNYGTLLAVASDPLTGAMSLGRHGDAFASSGVVSESAARSVPATLVVAGSFDLSGITHDTGTPIFRVNGSDVTRAVAGVTNSGGGSFGSHALYLGARGEASLYAQLYLPELIMYPDRTNESITGIDDSMTSHYGA